MSEHAAYLRIEAARAARRWPAILRLLAEGALHLTAISLLSPHLTEGNHNSVLAAARHKSKRELEEMVAALRPQPAVPSSVRRLPAPKPSTPAARSLRVPERVETCPPPTAAVSGPGRETRPPAAEVKPLAPERYKVQFTVSGETHAKPRSCCGIPSRTATWPRFSNAR